MAELHFRYEKQCWGVSLHAVREAKDTDPTYISLNPTENLIHVSLICLKHGATLQKVLKKKKNEINKLNNINCVCVCVVKIVTLQFSKEVSYVQQGCIQLIKSTIKISVFYFNIFLKQIYSCSGKYSHSNFYKYFLLLSMFKV